jgi:hypothetical protein
MMIGGSMVGFWIGDGAYQLQKRVDALEKRLTKIEQSPAPQAGQGVIR